MVVAGEGERCLQRVAAGADDHRRLPPGPQPCRELLGGGAHERHGGDDADPAGEHPDTGEIDLQQIEQRRVGDERQQRHDDDVAHLLPERPPPAVMAQLMKGGEAGRRQRRQDAGPLEAPVLVGEVDQAAEPERRHHRQDVDARQKDRAAELAPGHEESGWSRETSIAMALPVPALRRHSLVSLRQTSTPRVGRTATPTHPRSEPGRTSHFLTKPSTCRGFLPIKPGIFPYASWLIGDR